MAGDPYHRYDSRERGKNSKFEIMKQKKDHFERIVCSCCGKKHLGKCLNDSGKCFRCKKFGHKQKDCPLNNQDGKIEGWMQRPVQPNEYIEGAINIEGKPAVNKSLLTPKEEASGIGLQSIPARAFTLTPQIANESTKIVTDPGSSVPGYFPPEGPPLASHRLWNADNSWATSSEFLRNDLLQPKPGGYKSDGLAGVGSQGVPGYVGLPAGAIAKRYSPLEDPALLRRDAALGIKPDFTDIERSEPFKKSDGLLVDESNVLFVDGLPRDCTRREVAHLFRPFIGFKEIRVVHKEPRRVGDKGHVLCFVEFDDAKCALTALQALQGYKFDDKKPDAPALRIQFAKFPFRLPQIAQKHGIAR